MNLLLIRVALTSSVLALAAPSSEGAVNVTRNGPVLTITGDNAPDQVIIEGNGHTAEVTVIANGFPHGTFVGVRDIRVKLKGGDDDLEINAIDIGGDLTVKLGSGDDALDIDPEGTVDHEVFIGGDVDVNMGGQAGDVCDFREQATFTVTIGGNLRIRKAADVAILGEGLNASSEEDDVHIGGDLRIESARTVDVNADLAAILLEDVDVGGETRISTGGTSETVRANDCHFAGRLRVELGAGNDTLDFGNGPAFFNEFNSKVVLDGGLGTDLLIASADNVFEVPPKIKSF